MSYPNFKVKFDISMKFKQHQTSTKIGKWFLAFLFLFYDFRLSSKRGCFFEPLSLLKKNSSRSKHTIHQFINFEEKSRLRYHQNPIQIYFCENHGNWVESSGSIQPWQLTTSCEAKLKGYFCLIFGCVCLDFYHQHNLVTRITTIMMLMMIINLLQRTRCVGNLQLMTKLDAKLKLNPRFEALIRSLVFCKAWKKPMRFKLNDVFFSWWFSWVFSFLRRVESGNLWSD